MPAQYNSTARRPPRERNEKQTPRYTVLEWTSAGELDQETAAMTPTWPCELRPGWCMMRLKPTPNNP